MFQFIRRVSGSLLPRPDRPWRDDATSHAPTIGRKRRYSVTERDNGDAVSSTAKRMKNDPVKPCTKCDSVESPKGDTTPHAEAQEVKEVTKGVKEVDLEDTDKVEDASSSRPEGVPLPDSPSGSPEPEPESPEPGESDATEETKDQGHADDGDSVASSAPEDDAEETAEVEPVTANTNADASACGTGLAQGVIVATVESSLHDTPGTLEVKA